MKKPYLKKLRTVGKITVWIVDGEYVRDRLSEEFTNFAQHYRFRFIPTNEFWIDKEYDPGEEDFFIHHLLVEWWLARQGMDYEKALGYADRSERAERRKSCPVCLKHTRGNAALLKRIHKKRLAIYRNGLEVWLVRGELVRDFYFTDYSEGGHDKVYAFVPKGEIWIDDDLSPHERRFVLLHEVHERRLMADGWEYLSAHRSASEIEYACRHHPALFPKKLREEIRLNEL